MTLEFKLALVAVGIWLMAGGSPAPRKRVRVRSVSSKAAPLEHQTAVLDALAAMGWPRREVNASIRTESGWNPAARNPTTDASGLIQFMPRTLELLGWKQGTAAFRQLSAVEQIPWVQKYFSRLRWREPGDTYVALAYPAALGKDDGHIVALPGSPVWRQNPSWRVPGGGPVTAGSIRDVLRRRGL